jgi:hypothetical protein
VREEKVLCVLEVRKLETGDTAFKPSRHPRPSQPSENFPSLIRGSEQGWPGLCLTSSWFPYSLYSNPTLFLKLHVYEKGKNKGIYVRDFSSSYQNLTPRLEVKCESPLEI